MQIAQALQQAQQQLSHYETAKLDTEVILSHCIGCNRTHLYAYPEEKLSASCYEEFLGYIQLRKDGHPVAHLVGYREFWSLEFKVTKDTLIPRPETECLVEQALTKISSTEAIHILDLGTGTGAIAIALATERPLAIITATDITEAVLAIAKENAESHQAEINFIQADWLNFSENKHYNIIVSNPPYIDRFDPCLAQGDVRFEPESALIAKNNGLADLNNIIALAKNFLVKNGWLILEHGFQQGQAVRAFFQHNHYQQIKTFSDYAGHERITLGQNP
ncbi:MAG: peptide chain release factor N(5)-glutamine methyltransferase [Pseudomonadota bacterium]